MEKKVAERVRRGEKRVVIEKRQQRRFEQGKRYNDRKKA